MRNIELSEIEFISGAGFVATSFEWFFTQIGWVGQLAFQIGGVPHEKAQFIRLGFELIGNGIGNIIESKGKNGYGTLEDGTGSLMVAIQDILQ